MQRRDFLARGLEAGALSLVLPGLYVRGDEEPRPRQFRLWACGDSHVGTDLRHGRESLGDAIRQSEFGGDEGGPPFEWDIALHVGDLSGNQGPPNDEEGHAVISQYGALKKHRREDFYDLAGNHDGSGPEEPTQWWFKKWVDPTGENSKYSGVHADRRKFPVVGTWERYAFQAGNLQFLVMSDRNDGGPPVGRDLRGGYPAGAVTSETFEWWKKNVVENDDKIIISAHHHMLKETTVASGEWEGFKRQEDGTFLNHYHGYYANGGPKGASYLYWLDGQPDAQAFERYLSVNPNAIDIWFGGHTHSHPDDNCGGRTHIERKWDVNFINCSALTRHHGNTGRPMSRLLTFTNGSPEVRVQCYLHTSDYAPQGWYAPAERTIKLSKPFQIG